jgi:hypothetical protein
MSACTRRSHQFYGNLRALASACGFDAAMAAAAKRNKKSILSRAEPDKFRNNEILDMCNHAESLFVFYLNQRFSGLNYSLRGQPVLCHKILSTLPWLLLSSGKIRKLLNNRSFLSTQNYTLVSCRGIFFVSFISQVEKCIILINTC